MKKWTTKTLAKGLATLAMTAVIGLGAAMPASAAHGSGTAAAPVEAAITKELTIPPGATMPNAEFVFTATPVELNGDQNAAATMPALNAVNMKVDFTGSTSNKLQTADILDGVQWGAAGEYVYTIKEDAGSSYFPQTDETVTYSKAEYTLYVYVDYDAATSTYYAKEVATKVEKDDDGVAVAPGSKVNPIPGDGTTTFSELAFVNKYAKQGGQEPSITVPDDLFTLYKKVDGTGADQTRYFDFEITATLPAGAPATAFYKGYVMSISGVITNPTHANGLTLGSDVKGSYFELPVGVKHTIKLKHGETLYLDDIFVGATVAVNEKGTLNYTASADVVSNAGPVTTLTGNPNSDLASGALIVSDKANKTKAYYTNAFSDTTETGISMSTMPFILLIAVAIGGLGLYTLNRSRKHS